MAIIQVKSIYNTGYGNAPMSIMSEKITHWKGYECYGSLRTKVYLENGTEIVVDMYPEDFDKLVDSAIKKEARHED